MLLATSALLPGGLLTRQAWQLLVAGPVFAARTDHPQAAALTAAGVEVRIPPAGLGADALAGLLAERAADTGTVTWLCPPEGVEEGLVRAVLALTRDPIPALQDDRPGSLLRVEVVHGSWNPPGAEVLEAVAVMNRLRSPGGCPWDAAQTHQSLVRYLLEEAYETAEAIETGDLDVGLREELGDLLLQVLFHARIAADSGPDRPAASGGPPPGRFDIDDVARDLVAKLRRRHPHVFGGATAADPAAVERSWEEIKAVEKGRRSVLEGVPTAQPALAYAAAVLGRAARAGLRIELPDVGTVAPGTAGGDLDRLGAALLATVAAAVAAGQDPEAALRRANERLRAQIRDAERDTLG